MLHPLQQHTSPQPPLGRRWRSSADARRVRVVGGHHEDPGVHPAVRVCHVGGERCNADTHGTGTDHCIGRGGHHGHGRCGQHQRVRRKAADAAYAAGAKSVSIESITKTELAIGIKGSPCIGEP